MEKNFKKSLTKGLIHKLSTEYNIKLLSYNFFRIIKFSSKFDVEMKLMNYTEVRKSKTDSRLYIAYEVIDKVKSKKKPKILELIVKIFLGIDDKYLIQITNNIILVKHLNNNTPLKNQKIFVLIFSYQCSYKKISYFINEIKSKNIFDFF